MVSQLGVTKQLQERGAAAEFLRRVNEGGKAPSIHFSFDELALLGKNLVCHLLQGKRRVPKALSNC